MEIKEPTPRQLLALLGAMAFVLFFAALFYYPSLIPTGNQTMPVAASAFEDKLNLNTATVEQLQLLPGIGETKAKAIVSYREQHGEFTSTEQLLEVEGIGETIYAGLKDYVFV